MGLTRQVLTTISLMLGLVLLQGGVLAQADFRRGDANVDGVVDLSDAAFLIDFFSGVGRDGPCHDAMDANDDGILDLSDPLDVFFFLGNGFLPDPGPQTPGPDPSADDISCADYRPAAPLKLADVALGFECPSGLTGAPGEAVRFVAFATLAVSGDTTELGPAGWSLSLGVEGLRIVEVTTQGTLAQRFPSETQPIDPELDLGLGPQGTGVVSAVLLYQDFSTRVPLPWNGTHRILRLTLEATVPQDGTGAARLFFADGKAGRGQPVRNLVVFDGSSQFPGPSGLGSCEIPIRIAACDLDPLPDEPAAGTPWEEGFDAYPCGSDVIDQGGWEGWAGNPEVGADLDCSTAFSEPASLALRPDSDVVHRFDVAGGLWSLRTKVLIPSDHSGAAWFILLNQYEPEYGLFTWSTQVSFGGERVASHGGGDFFSSVGRSVPVIPDTWVELRVDVDLDRNLQTVFYDGEVLHETVWQHNGLGAISALDLYSAGGSAAYFDDLRLEPGREDSDCNANCVPDSLDLAGSASFAAPVFYESGSAMAAADLDGDGGLDLISFGAGTGVAALFNDGRGTFDRRQGLPIFNADVLIAADFDGARGLDLIAGGRFLEVPLTVLRNRGDGSFVPDEGLLLPGGGILPCPDLAECGPALDGAAGDLDGDGDLDLALAASFGNVWLFENQGGARFQLAGSLLEPARRVRTADLDGDGRADLVTANSDRQRSLALFRNEGTWALAPAGVLELGEIVRDLVLADLDGDEDLDIAGTSGGDPEQDEPASTRVFVFKQSGSGSFAAPEIFPAGSTVEAIDAADLDGDGGVDLAVAGGPWHVWVLRNRGGGAFGRPMPRIAGDGPNDIVAAELTGDGKPDLAVTSIGSRDLALFANATESAASDCNRNGMLDDCDLAEGRSLDSDADGVPDECGRNQLPGDCNQDARTDIADPVCLLGHLFLGSPGVLPCEAATAAPGNLALIDFNGDHLINIVDPIGFLGWLFLPSFPPHVLGVECVRIDGCSEVSGCVTDG